MKSAQRTPSKLSAKAPTGITGFDEITGGGLPRGRTTLLVGGPGSGKTILALQVLVHGARHCREPGIFVSFEETSTRIASNAEGFGWKLDELGSRKLFFMDAQPTPDLIQSGSFDLGGMLAALGAQARAMNARRIVFDALDIVLALLPDAATQRREIYRLHEWLLASRLTGVITAKAHQEDVAAIGAPTFGIMQFMVDCSVALNHSVVLGVSQRNLRVQKYRGSSFDENESPFLIGASGLEVAVARTLGRVDTQVTHERVSSGVKRLDTMLGGGYYRGASVLITGFPGTAKTTMSGAFAEAACRRGERTMFVSFDSDGAEVIRNLASVGIRLDRYVKNGFLRMVSARTITGSAETYLVRIKTLAQEHKARCLVIDPVSTLSKSGNEQTAHSVAECLSLYSREVNFFDAQELALLTELSGDISFAVRNIAKQQKFDQLSRIRAVSSAINAAIVRTRERKALLHEVCRITREHGKFAMIWIGAIDHDKQEVEPIAWAGFTDETARAVTWATISSTKGTIGEAIRTRMASIRNDFKSTLRGGELRQQALERGYRASLSLPVVVDDKAVAVVVLFAPGAGFFDTDEIALLNEVASDLSFALETIEKQKKLDYLAYYDALTGLANRSLFLERVGSYMRSAASGNHRLALFLVDLERFKNINDTLGQSAGDVLLRDVAQWLTLNLADANLLARVGSDHFAVVLPEVRQDGNVTRLLEKMIGAFLEHPFRLNDSVFRIAAKVGVALFPDDGTQAETLFKHAEAALKKAKASGDRYLFYMQQMTATVAGRLTMENQLRQALERDEFVLHYQPKVDLATGKVTSAEALIRWNDPNTGLVPPGKFIPCLEETGLIYEAGRWAMRKALEDYLRWRTAGLPCVRVAVNVSPLQLRNRAFVTEVERAIALHAHAAEGLELEITESLIMEDVSHSIATLRALRAMGITIAIDDFGTGFSSLSYLAKLPVDALKIDRSFVIDMTSGPQGLALVSTIINLAHSLKLKVIAEGVETEEQSRLLRLLSCDEMQGFLFSKPLPSDLFETRFLGAPVTAGASARGD